MRERNLPCLEQEESGVLPLPAIALTASDYPRLEQLARIAAQQGDMNAIFLLAEINRAEIVPGDGRDVESIVTIGSWVTYLTDWSVPRKTVQLVWPEDLMFDPTQVSVLSGLGAALLGLQAGDQMPYFVAMHECHQGRKRASIRAKDRSPRPLLRAPAFANGDDDPGPTAA
jgi:regulator of nucleoside diphosphate kinase